MIVTIPLAGLFEILFPILLAVWFTRRYKTRWSVIAAGALAFLAAQIVHIPVLYGLTAAFQNGVLPAPPFAYHVVFNAALLGLLAGLFETTARWVAFRILGDRVRTWEAGVTLGIGHGGAESALFVGLPVLVTFVSMLALRGSSQAVDPSLAGDLHAQVMTYFSQSWDIALAGMLERLTAITMHVALSLVVLQVFLRRNGWFFLAAVLWHALTDAGTAMMSQLGWNPWAIEAVLAISIPINLAIILALRPRQASVQPASQPGSLA